MVGANFLCTNENCAISGSLDQAWQDIEVLPISGSGSFHAHCPECSTALWFNVSGSSVIQQ